MDLKHNTTIHSETSNKTMDDEFIFPVSFSQERLWFLEQLEKKTSSYNMAGALRLEGDLDTKALQRALNKIVNRHEILSTTFAVVNGTLSQVVSPTTDIPIKMVVLKDHEDSNQSVELQRLIRQESQRPFNLNKGPLLNVTLYKLGSGSYVLLMTMHHIIGDGWSMGVLVKELSVLYDAFAQDLALPLEELTIQYGDYTLWLHEQLSGELLEKKLDYWRERLAGTPTDMPLPTDYDRPSSRTFQGDELSLVLPEALTNGLRSLSKDKNVTLFTTVLAGLKLLLYKWTGQLDVVVGTVTSGRDRAEIEPLIGCFINFLALRSKLSDEQTVETLLEAVGSTVLDAYPHQDCPFEKVVEAVNPDRQEGTNPIYNVALLLQNYPLELQFSKSISAHPFPLETGSALLDLRFEVFESPTEILIRCEYDTDLFILETINELLENYKLFLQKMVDYSKALLSEFELTEALKSKVQSFEARTKKPTLAISATFTAEPIAGFFDFWATELQDPYQLEFAPYNQVFQQLLDINGLLNNSSRGTNVLLIRLEDWQKDINKMEHTVQEFVSALSTAIGRSGSKSYLVVSCPPSPGMVTDPSHVKAYRNWENEIKATLSNIGGIHLVTSEELQHMYHLESYYDPDRDAMAHIPYTQNAFAVLATCVVRTMDAIKRNPYKVVVLDCDNTLWGGICGEDGATGVDISAPYRALQEFMLSQQSQGKILCLCSKNEPEDVFEVFDTHDGMLLKREHIVLYKINWLPKSENIKALAKELNLGLDSFIFVDDNPVECAEVGANCPEVLTLQLPAEPDQIPSFLDHVWAFDTLTITDTDKNRTEQYQQNIARKRLMEDTMTFNDFLEGLQLQIEITPAVSDQYTRLSQLTQRTNQFNFNTIRRTEVELKQLLNSSKMECLVVHVKDRFGDYGLVGEMLFYRKENSLEVDTFLLSCRALGRGVEYKMLSELGAIAQKEGVNWVVVTCIATEKNRPARDFLDTIGKRYGKTIDGGLLYNFPVKELVALVFAPGDIISQGIAKQQKQKSVAQKSLRFDHYQRIAQELKEPEQIVDAMEAKKKWKDRALESEYIPPRDDTEIRITSIWQNILKVQKIGIHDNFFALGGSSLLGVELVNHVRESFGIELPLSALFQGQTISELAKILSGNKDLLKWSPILPIRATGTKTPFFCIPGAGGNVLYFYDLARFIDDERPFYGLQSLGLDSNSEPHTKIEDMASYYIGVIKEVQPEGPYLLGGHSFGGYVAYEMAVQLQQKGENVSLLAVIDAPAPFMLASYNEDSERDEAIWLLEMSWIIESWLGKDLGIVEDEVRAMDKKAQLQYFKESLEGVNILPPDSDLGQFRRLINVFKANQYAESQYRPEKSIALSSMLLCRASEAMNGDSKGRSLTMTDDDVKGWQWYTKKLEIATAPGNHITMLAQPHVEVLGKTLGKYLDSAD